MYLIVVYMYYIIIYSKSNNKEETIKWKDAGDFVYVILYTTD